jgi:SAM-dependent methyltransferase
MISLHRQVGPEPSMDKNSFDLEFEITGFHWWFVVRRKLLRLFLSSTDPLPSSSILDVGCGVGSNFSLFESLGVSAIGLDRSFYALSLASQKFRFALTTGDMNALPFKSNSIGLIVASDVLEHLDDDTAGIHELHRTLVEGGKLILTVPAFRLLWGIQDLVTGHKRRYSKPEIVHKLNEEGFHILRASYFNFFLFLPILFTRMVIRLLNLRLESENKMNSPLINSILKAIFSLEPILLKYFSFPFGVSIFCIAQK